jgi:hypothetical protein
MINIAARSSSAVPKKALEGFTLRLRQLVSIIVLRLTW